jgi:hypothetical protein
MLRATSKQINWGGFQLLVIGSQIDNLIPNFFFGHKLCFQYPNGSCEPILDIHFPRAFHWCKELVNPMNFYPYNCSLKIRKSIRILTPKVGVHLGMWGLIPSHFPTLLGTWNVTLGLHSRLAPLQALALVASLRLGLQHMWFIWLI